MSPEKGAPFRDKEGTGRMDLSVTGGGVEGRGKGRRGEARGGAQRGRAQNGTQGVRRVGRRAKRRGRRRTPVAASLALIVSSGTQTLPSSAPHTGCW